MTQALMVLRVGFPAPGPPPAIGGGRPYSEPGTESRANPDDQELAGLVQTAFRGETQIALYAAVAASAGAAGMLLLALGGVWHARRTSPDIEIGAIGSTPRRDRGGRQARRRRR